MGVFMEIQKVKINNLKPAKYNPRTLTKKQYSDLKASLSKFGLVDPVIVNSHPKRKNIVIGGHQRLKVWEELGNLEIDCVYVKLSEKEEMELNVRLNKNTGEWDWEILAKEWDQDELLDWGFDDSDFEGWSVEEVEAETKGDDDVPESAPPITVLGDIYELGGVHRVMCGDSLSSDAVDRLMDGKKAVLAHNDPPYGMKKEKDGIKNDNLNYDDLLEFNIQWIPLQFSHLEDNGSFYCWGIDEPLMDIYSHILKPLIKTQKATFRNLITWNKGYGQGQMSEEFRSYPRADEKCLFVMCGVQGFNNNADNYFEGWDSIRLFLVQEKKKLGLTNKELTEHLNTYHQHYWSISQWSFPTKEHYTKLQELGKTNNIDAFKKEYDELKKEYDEIKKEYYSTRAYFNNTNDNMTNVWDIGRTKGKEREQTGGHATPKPLELCDRVIKSSSPDGAIVTDWFLGSGSTLISCEKLGRKCYGMELDPKYCDVIVKRYVKFCKDNNRPYSVIRNGEVCKDFDI
jgi:DNA modification methylase